MENVAQIGFKNKKISYLIKQEVQKGWVPALVESESQMSH